MNANVALDITDSHVLARHFLGVSTAKEAVHITLDRINAGVLRPSSIIFLCCKQENLGIFASNLEVDLSVLTLCQTHQKYSLALQLDP